MRSYLDGDSRWRRRRTRLAHLVAFPTVTIAQDLNPTDCPRWMVIDKHQLGAAAKRISDALTNQDNENPAATQRDIDDLVKIFTARPLSQRDLVAVAEDARSSATCSPNSRRQSSTTSG
jgi:hypothetical protein